MILKHKFYFFFWKLFMYLEGIKKGSSFFIYSEEKGKHIEGVVECLSGDSISNEDFYFSVYINWSEPIQGYDPRFYSSGVYDYKDLKSKLNRKV